MEDIGMEDFRQQEVNQIKHQISVQQQNERLMKLKGNMLALTAINGIKNKFKTKNRNFQNFCNPKSALQKYKEMKYKTQYKKMNLFASQNKVYNIMTQDYFIGKTMLENKNKNHLKVSVITDKIHKNIEQEDHEMLKDDQNEKIRRFQETDDNLTLFNEKLVEKK